MKVMREGVHAAFRRLQGNTRLVWLSLRNSARAIEMLSALHTKPLTRWWRARSAIRAKSYLMARHHHLSPDLLSDEQVQTYLLHLLQGTCSLGTGPLSQGRQMRVWHFA